MLAEDADRLLLAVAEIRALVPAQASRGPLVGRAERDLLCALAYVALGVGDSAQATTLLRLVVHERPDDAEVVRLLAYAEIASGDGVRALASLDRLAALDGGFEAAPGLLMRSQALRLAGRIEEGRICFRSYVAARGHTEENAP